jgi:hypothetical protein
VLFTNLAFLIVEMVKNRGKKKVPFLEYHIVEREVPLPGYEHLVQQDNAVNQNSNIQ